MDYQKKTDFGPRQIGETLDVALARLGRAVEARAAERKATGTLPSPHSPAERSQAAMRKHEPSASMRRPPAGDTQPDFFIPSLREVRVTDGVDLMDVAVFRIGKSQMRRGDIIRYELSDAIIEVAGGAHGMATIWDYDIVLMMVSYLADAVRKHRDGRGPQPTNKFRPHAVEIFRFCRMPDGGQQYENLGKALDRLQGTFVKISQVDPRKRKRQVGHFPLLGGADVVSHTETGKVGQVELVIPDWLFMAVCGHKTPEVLTVNPDYLLLKGGLARFIYRLARKAAGRTSARYYFSTVHMRSGSTRELKKFNHELRQLVKANNLPDYDLAEEKGAEGPLLVMTARNQTEVIA